MFGVMSSFEYNDVEKFPKESLGRTSNCVCTMIAVPVIRGTKPEKLRRRKRTKAFPRNPDEDPTCKVPETVIGVAAKAEEQRSRIKNKRLIFPYNAALIVTLAPPPMVSIEAEM